MEHKLGFQVLALDVLCHVTDAIYVVCIMQYALDLVCSMAVMVVIGVVCNVDTSLLLHFRMLKITLHHSLQLVWFTNTRGYNTSPLVDHEVYTN